MTTLLTRCPNNCDPANGGRYEILDEHGCPVGSDLCQRAECLEIRRRRELREFGQTTGKYPVSGETIERFVKNRNLLTEARKGVHSCFLVGPTGIGKTLVLKYWWNECWAKTGEVPVFISENVLFEDLTDEDTAKYMMRKWLKKTVFLLDDFFREHNWKDQSSDREFAGRRHRAFEMLLDRCIYDRMGEVTVAITGLVGAEKVRAGDMARRITDLTGGAINL